MSELELEIAKLDLRPGDILVVKLKGGRGMPKHDVFTHLIPGVKILYIPDDIDLAILTREEIEQRVAA